MNEIRYVIIGYRNELVVLFVEMVVTNYNEYTNSSDKSLDCTEV